MCGFSRKIAYALTFTTFLATLFFVIAVGAPNWLKADIDTGFGTAKYTLGLNKACTDIPGSGKDCTTYDYGKCDTSPYTDNSGSKTKFDKEPCDKFKSVVSLALLAVLLAGIALFALAAMLALSSIGSVPQVLAFLLVLGAGVCGMIAMSTYADLAKDSIKNLNDSPGTKAGYDFSFALLILGWIFSYATFVLAFFTGAASGTAKISGSTA